MSNPEREARRKRARLLDNIGSFIFIVAGAVLLSAPAVMAINFACGLFPLIVGIVIALIGYELAGKSAAAEVSTDFEEEREREKTTMRSQPFPTIDHLGKTIVYQDGYVGRPFRGGVSVLGGVRPYAWAVPEGALPPGVGLRVMPPSSPQEAGLNEEHLEIYGIPTLAGTYAFTLEARDRTDPPHAARKDCRVTIWQDEGSRHGGVMPPLRYDPGRYRD